MRTAKGSEQVSRDHEHDADGDPPHAFGEQAATLPARRDRQTRCSHGVAMSATDLPVPPAWAMEAPPSQTLTQWLPNAFPGSLETTSTK